MRSAARVAAAIAAATLVMAATPADAAVGYRLATSVIGGKSIIDRWDPCQKDISYRIDAAALPAARRAAAVADVRGAFARVAAATGIAFRYAGLTTYIPTGSKWPGPVNAGGQPAEIVVAWIDAKHPSTLLGAGAAGTGGFSLRAKWTSKWGWVGYSGRGFVVLSAAIDPHLRPGFGSGVTRGELLLHEIGHVMGLGHSDLTSQIMYPVLKAHPITTYATFDLIGLRRLGRAAGCFPISLWPQL